MAEMIRNAPQQGTLAALIVNPDAFTTTLIAVLIETFGSEALSWAPETIQMELQETFHVPVSPLAMDKITAGITLLTSDDFFQRLPRFIQICNVLSGSELTPDFDKADAAECAWGLTEALLLYPPEGDEPFSTEIRAYLGEVLDEEGIADPPDLLKIAIRSTPQGNVNSSGLPTEDPELFLSAYQARQHRNVDIEETVTENLQALLQQLAMLPDAPTAQELLAKLKTKKR